MGLWELCQITEDIAVGVKHRSLVASRSKKKKRKLREKVESYS